MSAVSLSTLRTYVASLSWVEGGLMSQDITQIIDFLESTPDSRWFVAQTRRALAVLRHWQGRIRYAVRRLEIDVAASRDVLDPQVRQTLRTAHRQIKMRYVDAAIMSDPNHRILVDSLQQHELILETLEGIELSLDTSLVVQEAVAVRHQEIIDSQTP